MILARLNKINHPAQKTHSQKNSPSHTSRDPVAGCHPALRIADTQDAPRPKDHPAPLRLHSGAKKQAAISSPTIHLNLHLGTPQRPPAWSACYPTLSSRLWLHFLAMRQASHACLGSSAHMCSKSRPALHSFLPVTALSTEEPYRS